MEREKILKILRILNKESEKWDAPVLSIIRERSNRNPYQLLISCLLSLRTKDEVTFHASKRLFEKANNPYEMLKLKTEEIESLIYPVGFYRVKAKKIKEISKIIVEKYKGEVPKEFEDLIKLPGVGRKTANIVLAMGFGKPTIAVDTHVHRISNRLGIVETKDPHQTEKELREKIPKEWWFKYNDLLVAFGQTICKPIKPRCWYCPVRSFCYKKGIDKKFVGKGGKTYQK